MTKILSIIIPSYNMEKYLEKCLSSLIIDDLKLLQQLEVLIINDGSKDNTSEIGYKFERQFPKSFRVIDKENGNYGSCINRGIKEANGKYVKVLDADDYFDTAEFKVYLNYLRNYEGDILLTDFKRVLESGYVVNYTTIPLPQNQTVYISNLENHVIASLWMHQITYKLEIIKKINYKQTEGISYTDQEWIFLPFGACQTITYLPCFLYYYLVGREGQTINPTVWNKNFWMEIKGTKVMLEEYDNAKTKSDIFNLNYLETRLKIRCKTFYIGFLREFDSDYNKERMQEFDALLKEKWPSLYNYLDDQTINKFIPFHYVRYWRKYGVKHPPYWFFIKYSEYLIKTAFKYVKSF